MLGTGTEGQFLPYATNTAPSSLRVPSAQRPRKDATGGVASYRGGAARARAIGETKMQLRPDDLWTRDPTRHLSFRVPEQPDVPLWRYMSGKRFRWLVEKQRLYMPRIAQLAGNDAREGTVTDWNHHDI